jgi:hypothetical protein
MVRWLFTVSGCETPASDRGDFTTLTSPSVYGSFSYIRLPKGFKAKIWAKRLAGTAGFMLIVSYTPDVTAPQPSWSAVDVEYLASAGSLEIDKRRPIVVPFRTGNEAIKFSYSYATARSIICFSADIEVTDEDEYPG